MNQGDEVVYSIVVPNLSDHVAIEAARRTINDAGCPSGLIHIGENSVSVPRLYTLWRGSGDEQQWQEQIKSALPTALIDVQPWTPAPGYLQGEVGEAA